MNEFNTEKLRSCFNGKCALACLVLAAVISFAATASAVEADTMKPASGEP